LARFGQVKTSAIITLPAIVFPVVLCLLQGMLLLDQYEDFDQSSDHAVVFEQKGSDIARFDVDLTMSARMYAATGDPIWRQRYLALPDLLADALGQALDLADDQAAKHALASVADANERLISMEDASFDLISAGDKDIALALLTSDEYRLQKDRYSLGLTRALEISRLAIQSRVDGHRRTLLLIVGGMFLTLILTLEIWRRYSVRHEHESARQMEVALEKERKLNGLQRQFVSMVSHEFRTPLAIIDGRARRLDKRADTMPSDQIRAIVHSIRGAVQRLTGLMEGVLNLSRMEEGKIHFKPSACNLQPMIEEIVAGFSEINPDRTFDLQLDGLPTAMRGDPGLLHQVITNLVSNAIKYSETGTMVRVEGRLLDDEIMIAVHDRGVGIAADEIDKLFQRFFRASSSEGIAGTGIGLHFAMHLVELHEGRMTAESELGEGSIFRVFLPNKPAEAVIDTAPAGDLDNIAA